MGIIFNEDYDVIDSSTPLTVTFGDNVTNIHHNMFSDVPNLKEVSFLGGNSLVIDNGAFFRCRGLEKVTFSDNQEVCCLMIQDEAFRACSSLKSISFPNSVGVLGHWSFEGCTSLEELTINSSDIWSEYGFSDVFYGCENISKIKFDDKVEFIPDYYLKDLTSLKELYIGTGVKEIGKEAFKGCTGLKKLTVNTGCEIGKDVFEDYYLAEYNDFEPVDTLILGDNVTNLSYFKKVITHHLKYISLGNGITELPNYAICSYYITDITLPSSLKTIGDFAFSHCKSLKNINIPESVTSIGKGAFMACSSLESIHLPESVTEIADSVFRECESLTDISLSPNTSVILNYAFYGCKSIENINLPDGLYGIGDYSFYKCSKLKKIVLPESMYVFGHKTFGQCYALKDITINSDIYYYRSGEIFKYENIVDVDKPNADIEHHGPKTLFIGGKATTISDEMFKYCGYIDSLTIGEGIKTIGKEAFYCCFGLTEVDFPESLTEIGDLAFSGCHKLKNIKLNETLTTIGDKAFEFCVLESLDIPESVKSIGSHAFAYSPGLNEITVHWQSPETVTYGTELFRTAYYTEYETTTLYVPEGCVDIYKATEPWSNFLTILEIGQTGVSSIIADGSKRSSTINLNGQRVPDNYRGFVIQNGKKLLKR